jgi:hypothetical protein
MKKETKQRVTAFVDPNLVKRAKVRGALEGLTISEVVEKALDAYAPKIEKDTNHISLKFVNKSTLDALIPEIVAKQKKTTQKHTKKLVVPR